MTDNARRNLIELLTPVIQNTVIGSEKSYDVFGMIILEATNTARALQRVQRKYKLTDDAIIILYRDCMLQIMDNVVTNMKRGRVYALNKAST